MLTRTKPTKHLWEELTEDQQKEFKRLMIHAGWKDESKYPNHVYQLMGATCHGWIDNYRQHYLKSKQLKPCITISIRS